MRIAAIALTLGLVGCSLLPPEYDNNEYELLARLETTVLMINENCEDTAFVVERIPGLEYDARVLHTYTFYIPQNTDVYGIAEILKDDVLQFKAQYDKGEGNKVYCDLKTKLFLQKVRAAMEAVAQKPRS